METFGGGGRGSEKGMEKEVSLGGEDILGRFGGGAGQSKRARAREHLPSRICGRAGAAGSSILTEGKNSPLPRSRQGALRRIASRAPAEASFEPEGRGHGRQEAGTRSAAANERAPWRRRPRPARAPPVSGSASFSRGGSSALSLPPPPLLGQAAEKVRCALPREAPSRRGPRLARPHPPPPPRGACRAPARLLRQPFPPASPQHGVALSSPVCEGSRAGGGQGVSSGGPAGGALAALRRSPPPPRCF